MSTGQQLTFVRLLHAEWNQHGTGVVSGVVADCCSKIRAYSRSGQGRLMLTHTRRLPASSSTTDPTRHYTDQYDVFTVGAGYVDVEAALNSSVWRKGQAMSPIATFNSNTNEVTLTDDPPPSGYFLHLVEHSRVAARRSSYRRNHNSTGATASEQHTIGTPSPVGLPALWVARPCGLPGAVGKPSSLGQQCRRRRN